MREPDRDTFDSNDEMDDDFNPPAGDNEDITPPPAPDKIDRADLHRIRRSIEDRLEKRRLREMQDLPFDDDDFDFDFDEDSKDKK